MGLKRLIKKIFGCFHSFQYSYVKENYYIKKCNHCGKIELVELK